MVTLRYSYVYHIFPTFEKQQTTQQSPQIASAQVPDGRSSRGSNRLLRISSLLRTSLTPKGDDFYVAVVAPRCREKTRKPRHMERTWKNCTGARENQSCLASKLEFMSSSSKFRISKEKRCDTIYYNTILLSLRKDLC